MGRSKSTTRLLADEPANLGPPFVGMSNIEPESGQAAEDATECEYQEGLIRAQEELAAEVEAFRGRVQESLRRISEYEETFAVEHEKRILELTLAAASRIVRERIDAGDEVAVRVLGEALAALPGSTRVKARLHPDDVESVVDQNRTNIEAGRIEVVADETLSRGGVILETDFGSIDATVETAEAGAREALLGAEGAP